MGQAAEERGAVERHFARSVLALLAVTPEALADAAFDGRMARVTSEDSFVPRGDAAAAVLLSQSVIESAARSPVRVTPDPSYPASHGVWPEMGQPHFDLGGPGRAACGRR